MRKSALPSSFAFAIGKNLRATAMKTLFFAIACLGSNLARAAISVVRADGNNICSNLAVGQPSPGFTTLGSMTISEGPNNGGRNDFGNGVNRITLTAPAGWQFATGVPFPSFGFQAQPASPTFPSTDVMSVTLVSVTSSVITIDITTSGVVNNDLITISGVRVQALSSGSANGSITANVISGNVTGMASTNMSNLSQQAATVPAVTIAASPSNSVCAGTAVTFTPTPSNAVTPTYTWYVNGISQGISSTFNYVPTNGNTVQAVMTSNGTCEVNSTPSSNVINMIVNTLPSISSANGSPNPLCETAPLTLNAIPNAGTAPFSYSWTGPGGYAAAGQSPVRNPVTINGGGVYNVTISDGNGCTAASSFATPAVIVNANPVVSATASPNPICEEQTLNLTTGIISGSPTTFQWSGPNGYASSNASSSVLNVNSLAQGIYTLVATDVNSCVGQANTLSVVVRPLPTISANAVPLDICEGNLLTLTSNPLGGTGGFSSFSWTGPGGYTASAEDPTPFNVTLANTGSYNVTVTDGAGCTSHVATTLPVTVHANPSTGVVNGTPNPACVGNTLSLFSNPSGGSGSYNYVWNGPSSFSANIQNPTRPSLTTAHAGTYSVTITDGFGCIARGNTGNIPVNTNPSVNAFATPTSICVGATLSLQAVATGGGGGYNYSWSSPGGFSSIAQNPSFPATLTSGGVYSVVVTDVNNCVSTPGITPSVTVHDNPTIAAGAVTNPICEGLPLQLTASPAGGGGSNTFVWSGPSSFTSTMQNPTINNVTVAANGNYTVTVTDVFGCSASNGEVIVVYARPTVNTISASPNPICANSTLNLNANAVGGTGSYSYAWSGPAGYTAATQAATRASMTTGFAGTYSVVATDGNLCASLPNTVAVAVNTLPTIVAGSTTNPICEGNTLALTSTPTAGSSSSFTTYSWTGPNSYVAAGQNPTLPNVTTAAAGTYSVNVTDGNGCTSATPGTVNIVVNTLPTATINSSLVPPCAGSTLNLFSTPAGATPFNNYSWNGPNGFVSNLQDPSISSVTTAAQGTYSFTVSDNNGCTSLPVTTFVTVNTNPTVFSTTVTPNPICAGATLNLNAQGAGGSGLYNSYSWTGPNGYTANTQAATLPNITTAGAGVYSVVVTDNLGCFSAPTPTSAVIVNTLPTITANATPNPLCTGATLALSSTPSPGSSTSFVSYSWAGPNGFTSIAQNPFVNNVVAASAGVYSVNVTDDNGCTSAAPGTTSPVIVWALPTVAVGSTPNPLCESAQLTLTVTPGGGSGVYTNYSWRGPNGFTSLLAQPTISPITMAGAGIYSVTVTDNRGCTSLEGASPLVIVWGNPSIAANASPNPICEGLTLGLTSVASGGTIPYNNYAWSGPGFSVSGASSGTNRTNIPLSGAGVYSVTVTDVNGCQGTNTVMVTVNSNPTITASVTPNPICEGNTLNLNATPAGGSGVYSTFAWSGPSGYTASTQAATRPNIAIATGAGVYNVTVTDNNGCIGTVATAAVVVNPNPVITASASPNPICEGNTLTLTGGASGGTTPYTSYSWTGPNSYSATVATPGTTIANISTAGAGVYSVTVTDVNGCMGSAVTTTSVTVNTNPVISIASASPDPICSGATLNLNASATGGSGVYSSFNWTGPGGFSATGATPSRVGIPTTGAGVYSVNVTDDQGCTSVAPGLTNSVVVNPSPTIVVTTNSPVCEGNNTLTLNSTPSGGTSPYVSFVWSGPLSFSATTQNTSISPVAPANSGVYNVTVTDNNGCFGSGLSTVTINPLPLVFGVTGGGSYCQGGAGVPIGLNGSENNVDYTLYFGSSIAGTQSGTGSAITFGNFTAAGATYSVSATNTLTGCSQAMSGNTSVTILPLPAQFDVTGGGDYCLNGTGVPVGMATTAVGFTYQLYRGATPVGSPRTGTGSAISFGLQTTVGTYTVLATNDFTGCQNVMNGSAVINTLPLPADHLVAGGGVGCEGVDSFHVGMTGSDFGIDYQLYNGGTAIGAPVPGNGGGIDFGLFGVSGTYTVLATNTTTGCQAVMSGQADFLINPAPQVFAVSGGGGYCIGGPGAVINLLGSQLGVEYQLYNGSAPVGLPVAGDGNPITFGQQFTAGTYSVAATNTSTFCRSNMSGSTVVVPNAPPAVYTVSGGGNYCDGGTGVPVMLSGSDAGVTYTVTDGSTSVLTGTGDGSAPFTIGNVTAMGTFSVVATNPVTTCTSNMTGDVTVTIDPLPLDQAITGGGARCATDPGLSIDLASSEAGVSYELFLAGVSQGAPIAGPGAIHFGTFTADGTYTVQATNTSTGCTTVLAGSAVIIVNPTPSAITGASSVCEGSIINLSDVDAPGTWSVDNVSIATIDGVTGDLAGVAAGTVNVTYTLGTGCYVTTPIVVNTTPSISGSTSVCVGSSVGLTGTPGGGAWSNPTPSIATIDATTGVITGVSAGADEVTYTLGTGCYMTRTQTVNALPVLPSITATATSVCEGAIVTYFNAQAGGTWSSSSPANATVDMFNGDVTGVLAGSANIIYGYTDFSTGCSNTTSLAVTVNPTPGISITVGDNNICSAASTTLSNASAGGAWSSDNNSVATVDGAGVVTGVAAGSVNISYTVTNVFGCSASTLFPMTIGNLLPASAVLPVGGASICGGNPVNLNVVSSGTLTFYQWVLNGMDILGANSSTYSTVTPGFYQVTIGDGSCTQTITAGTTVVAGPAPVILFDTLNNILYTGSFATYQWFYNGTPITGATGSLITPIGEGTYAVIVTDANNCGDTATFQLGHPVSVNNTNGIKSVRIYPNPATTTLFIDAPGKVFVTVLSADGKMLIERQEAVSINVSQLADGMYMIMVHDENGALIKADKFMKMQ